MRVADVAQRRAVSNRLTPSGTGFAVQSRQAQAEWESAPMKVGKLDRRARIESEARRLARSGEYRSFRSIYLALVARGFEEAAKVFANRWTCSELDRLCEQAFHANKADSQRAA